MRTIDSLGDLRGKRVLVRSDLNVPLDADKNITDDGRIRAALPTLNELRDAGARIVIMAHLGRPKGEVNPKYSLAPVAARLGELLGVDVKLAGDVVGGWMLARQAQAVAGGDDAWSKSKAALARVFASQVLAQAPGLAAGVMEGADDLEAVGAEALGA